MNFWGYSWSSSFFICIIGAGITGITCAYELSELGYSVNIVEKNGVCSGTTGNTTGKITSQHNAFYNYLIYSAKMYQSMSYLIAIETKKELPKGMYISVSNPNISIRKAKYEEKEILLIGGGDHKTGKSVTYEQAYGRLEEFAKKYYPDEKVLKKWNAEDCISLDKLPYIGQVSSFLPNVYVATGYKKWGMTLSNVATDIIVDIIRGSKNPYADIFSSLRLQPIKNHEEMKNMIIDSSKGLIIDKLKQADILESELPNDCGKIIEIENQKVGVYKDKNGKLFAINPICTHLGCLLIWNQIDRTWDCPCHGSRFRYDGKNIYDPAFNDLEVVEIE